MEKRNIPQKGASKKWSERLKKLGNQTPAKGIVDRLNDATRDKKKIAKPHSDVDL